MARAGLGNESAQLFGARALGSSCSGCVEGRNRRMGRSDELKKKNFVKIRNRLSGMAARNAGENV